MNKFKFSYKSGTSLARGTTIDEYLPSDVVAKLYELWDRSWGEPFFFRGGEKAITCEMIMEAPEDELVAAYGKKDSAKILAVAKNNVGR